MNFGVSLLLCSRDFGICVKQKHYYPFKHVLFFHAKQQRKLRHQAISQDL